MAPWTSAPFEARPDTIEPGSALTPTAEKERYEFLDVVRGFALVGIVLANMVSLSLYLNLPGSAKASMSTAATDRVLDFLELVFIEGKFYTIFSVLFGVGFSILLTRAESRSLGFRRFFLRRMFFLFVIGLLHAILFWHNDILEAYALCGALLLPFARARNRTILTCSAIALIAPVVLKLTGAVPRGFATAPRDLLFARFGFTAGEKVDIWTEGSFAEIVVVNAGSWFGQVDYLVASGMIFRIYGCFLLGLYIGRNDIHRNLHRYGVAMRRVALTGIGAGIPLNVIYARTFESESWLHMWVATVGIIPLSAGYVSLLALRSLRLDSTILVRTFAPVGRMALTNYVGQSIACMFIFRGVGWGLGGSVGPTLYLPIGLAVYLFQLALSRAWLVRFQFGPLEWLWRMLTYGRRVPLTKTRVGTRAAAG